MIESLDGIIKTGGHLTPIIYKSGEEITVEDIDAVIGRRPGQWTWTVEGAIFLHKRGFHVTYYSKAPLQRFLEGEAYIRKRYGKDGKMFNVYKLRTMHAYSEYLQEYIYKHNHLQDGGKFKNDFRISTEGRFFSSSITVSRVSPRVMRRSI